MKPYNSDVMQALKWMQNNAPKIQSLLQQENDWYRTYNTRFWENWFDSVFNIKTANPFGLQVWCIILGLPSTKFGLYPIDTAWAYGDQRENYVWSGGSPAPADANLVGGNFYGGSDSTLLNLDEVRYALMLRYAALVGNGRIEYVNRMLQWIFNDGEDWDYANKVYAYVADSTIVPDASTGAVTGAFQIEYRFGAGLNLSAQFINLLNTTQSTYGILPSFAGSKITAIQEP
ncbi:hypothetical protein BcepF1.097 [Burkholderia phage BcepF1]|uniref:Uncharacterized protein n=1 Tax=Burkholderia phage BcepF1 TaxID=2886897 RepID=A1Z001_9CAUD|nr:hypothetical protein BcepF1.097 [Burkholderia phage BcepF1]ABL96828.1 hypothetical protein BcepF1.097 [Burkholderia phage BcepF1]